MLGHLGVNVPDPASAKRYYAALMPPLAGFEPFLDAHDEFAFRPAGGKPGTYLFFSIRPPRQATTHQIKRGLRHLAFMVRRRIFVDAVNEFAIACGNTTIGTNDDLA